MWGNHPFSQKRNKATKRGREGGWLKFENERGAGRGRQYRAVFIKYEDYYINGCTGSLINDTF